VSGEQFRYPADHTRGVDGLALEILHNVQELIVHIWLLMKLHLDLVEIAKSVLV
jgi:hypothetical protein